MAAMHKEISIMVIAAAAVGLLTGAASMSMVVLIAALAS
jgi:hypothetical protein